MLARATLASVAALATFAAALPAAESGVAAAQPVRSCFFISQLTNTRAADERTLFLRVSGNKIYRMDLKNPCPGLRGHTDTIVLEPRGSGSICGPLDVDVSVTGYGTTDRCMVERIVRLSPDEVAALPKAVTP